MELTVIVPTRDRRGVLFEAIRRLGRQVGAPPFEVVVVDDGSTDGTPAALERSAPRQPFAVRIIRASGEGPAAARNRALRLARAPVCLFLNDDSWPRPDLLARHAAFHAANPAAEDALLGWIDFPPDPTPTPFMRWLAAAVFDYAGITDRRDAGGARFFTANVSAKTAFVREAGGFDEGFRSAAHEDIDLGLRLGARGMRLAFDPDAVVEHSHPMDLEGAIARMRGVGEVLVELARRHPEWPVPRQPGLRHRANASALTVLAAAGVRPAAVQRETWRFLCHEASREGYWEALRGPGRRPRRGPLRIGSALADLAARDPAAQMPSAGAS